MDYNQVLEVLKGIGEEVGKELLQELGTELLNRAEEYIKSTSNTIDDKILIPIIKAVKEEIN